MICKGCGAEILNNQFCPHCGKKVEQTGEITRKCINCGKGFSEGKEFCDVCGGSLVPIQSFNSPNMPPYQMPVQIPPQPGQTSPYQMPGQIPPQPGQTSPYQMPVQIPPQPRQLPPNMMPPYPQPMPYGGKQKTKILPIFIIVGVMILVFGGVIGILAIMNLMPSKDDQASEPDIEISEDSDTYVTDSPVINTPSDYDNYYNYLDGRDTLAFSQYSEVYMENGIAFYLNDVYITDNGDGTAIVECSMDLGAYIESSDLYSDDFMIVPLDAAGNILADATEIDTVTDSDGYSLTTPVVLDTSSYYSYTVSFTVPSDTEYLTFYGVNIQLDSTTDSGASISGPAYYIDITFE